jgi:hypothetical protein
MTPTEQAAKLLADVPRYEPSVPFVSADEVMLGPLPDAEWIKITDALSAIARHLATEDDLVERAEAVLAGLQGARTPTRKRAADTITALLARISALTAQIEETNAAVAVKGGTIHAPTQWAYDQACAAIEKHRAALTDGGSNG